MGAVRRAEGVVDVAGGARGRDERFGELGEVLLLALVEAHVLEQHDAARRELVARRLGDVADAVVRLDHLRAEQLREALDDRRDRERRVRRVLRPADVRRDDHLPRAAPRRASERASERATPSDNRSAAEWLDGLKTRPDRHACVWLARVRVRDRDANSVPVPSHPRNCRPR